MRPARSRHILRDIVLAGVLVMAAAVVSASEQFREWIPGVIALPEDMQIVSDRAIGSSVRMFSITTGADVTVLFEEWEQKLGENGYQIRRPDEAFDSRMIEFSGPGIGNGKIIVAPESQEGRSIIEFDATLE